jgi:SAM-dependent MidA family methyltransferase
MAPLPPPTDAARRHAETLASHIRREIAAQGWISFARFMELALYAPGLGYYSAGAAKLGAAGDFVTAPEISPLFGQCLARFAAEILGKSGGDLLELGAGSGRLAVELWRELERLGQTPRRYCILEVSADLARRQRAFFAAACPALAARAEWLTAPPESFTGLILANEVLDALPVHRVAWRADGIFEQGVALENGAFVWRERPAQGALRAAAERLAPAPGYASEIALAAPALVTTLAASLAKGALLFVDYGFGRREFYHPERRQGTLMCHYRHHAHGDPFFLPGLQDITAHVDFSAIAEAGVAAGLDLLGYTSQAAFLIGCGLTERLREAHDGDATAYLARANEAQRLTSPAEMGELFKVIALGRGIAPPRMGFARNDRRRTL